MLQETNDAWDWYKVSAHVWVYCVKGFGGGGTATWTKAQKLLIESLSFRKQKPAADVRTPCSVFCVYIRDSKAKAQVPSESEAFQVQAKCIKNDSQQERSRRLNSAHLQTSTCGASIQAWTLRVAPNGAEARCSFKDQPGFREKNTICLHQRTSELEDVSIFRNEPKT